MQSLCVPFAFRRQHVVLDSSDARCHTTVVPQARQQVYLKRAGGLREELSLHSLHMYTFPGSVLQYRGIATGVRVQVVPHCAST